MSAVPQNGSAGTVLIVDDEATMRDVLSKVVARCGYDTICVQDGIEALKIINTRPVCLLITDMSMPRLSGFGLLQMVRAERPNLPAILISGVADSQDVLAAFELGVTRFVRKPFRARDMVTVITEAISTGQALSRPPGHVPPAPATTGAPAHPASMSVGHPPATSSAPPAASPAPPGASPAPPGASPAPPGASLAPPAASPVRPARYATPQSVPHRGPSAPPASPAPVDVVAPPGAAPGSPPRRPTAPSIDLAPPEQAVPRMFTPTLA